MWEALEEICRREGQTISSICAYIESQRRGSSRTAAVRVFILRYFLAAATETADGDRTIVDLAYAKTGDTVAHDATGGYNNADVNGTKTKVYTKYLTGTLDADSSTSVAHSITDGLTKILSVTVACYEDNSAINITGDFAYGASADSGPCLVERLHLVHLAMCLKHESAPAESIGQDDFRAGLSVG